VAVVDASTTPRPEPAPAPSSPHVLVGDVAQAEAGALRGLGHQRAAGAGLPHVDVVDLERERLGLVDREQLLGVGQDLDVEVGVLGVVDDRRVAIDTMCTVSP
jgi:hypothetical protein